MSFTGRDRKQYLLRSLPVLAAPELVWIAVEAAAEYRQFGLTGPDQGRSAGQELVQSNTLIRRVASDPRYLLSEPGYILFVVYGLFSTLHLLR